MLALLLFAALTTSNTGMVGRLRLRVLRPCSTTMVDFTDPQVLTVRVALLFTTVFAVITSVLLVLLVRLQVHPLLAIEVVAAIGMLTAHVAVKVTGGSVGEATPAAS